MDNIGFYNASLGQNPDRVNAIAFCRIDIQLDSCRTCIQNATVELLKSCPYSKQAILWKDVCMLRYSNVTLIGNRADTPVVMVHNVLNVSSPEQFNENLRSLVDDLRGHAASGGSLVKVAAGNRTGPDFQTIFALLQCTPDISPEDCNQCLNGAAQYIPACCKNSNGVGILAPSCNLRYQTVPFYNITRIREVQAMVSVAAPPIPPVLLPGNGEDNTTRTVIVIVVPIVVCLVLAACVGIFWMRKIKMVLPEESNMASINDSSDADKMGQSGFGDVHKVI